MATVLRRSILRGMMRGAAVGVALPFLDAFLDSNGQAVAATGQRLPVRFGTWFWGCGITRSRWLPTQLGPDYEMPVDLAPMAAHRANVAILTGFNVALDGVANSPHITGNLGLRTGVPVPDTSVKAPTFDVVISDQVGATSRFRSLEISCVGTPASYSYRSASSPNPSETSPATLYQRLFVDGFHDPNAGDFKPDPQTMARQSVLSSVTDDRKRLMRDLGAQDRRRLDEYFSSVRQLEQQLALELEKPAPIENFKKPDAPNTRTQNSEIDNVLETHRLMAGLLANALACNQTRVFNMVFSDSASTLRRAGDTTSHHQLTHEELSNPKLGYQEKAAHFATRSMEGWGAFLDALASVKEGSGTLLDNCLVVAHSDCSEAKVHGVDGIPVMIAGNAGGRVRTGFHMAGNGDPISRVGLTVQQIMGVQIDRWGERSMSTNRAVTEIMA